MIQHWSVIVNNSVDYLRFVDRSGKMALGHLLVCLVVGSLSHSQGLQFTLDSTPDTFYCVHLICSVDVNQNDPRILSVVGLSISGIAESNNLITLASVTTVDVVPHVEPTKVSVINATGSVSRYHGNLILALSNETDCLLGSFLCEVDFVNVSGQSDVIREVVTPVNKGNCTEISSQLTNWTNTVDKQLADLKSDMEELKSQNTATEQELVRFETKLDTILRYLSRPAEHLTTSQHTEKRDKCLLWGSLPALCDNETDGGGWVIIQRRRNGDIDFFKGWDDYKKGFGTPDTDYWLGNDNIHNLTLQGYTNLRVDMGYKGVTYFAEYSNFSLADDISKYMLTVSGYHGNASNALNSGAYFSTFDRDNDGDKDDSCADAQNGAWWYFMCSYSNLNGMWGQNNFWKGVVYPESVTWSEMKVRQV